MKSIRPGEVEERVKALVQEANFVLRKDVTEALDRAGEREESPAGREVFRILRENSEAAARERLGLCQDTGAAVFFVDLGEDLRIEKDASLQGLGQAIERGMIAGYGEGCLRKSMVADPLRRANTGDNSPAFIHWNVVPGESFRVTFMAKGGGAENWSAVRMFAPAAGAAAVEDFVVETVDQAGPAACPPFFVGVGIGGNFEYVAFLAKKALLREPLGTPHPDPFYGGMEARLLDRINRLGTGPQGLGGRVTALAVHVENCPCHIASLPAAVNIQCHSHRVLSFEL
jgi:fumarate hydratase subunit alpha